MTAIQEQTYADRNQRALTAELSRVYARLAGDAPHTEPAVPAEETQLDRLVDLFQLSPFERDILLWCTGAELDARFATAFGTAYGDQRRTHPSFGLALAQLADPHWDAISPGRPLRYWRLVDLGTGPGLVDRPLQIDERVLHFLTGVVCLDPRLSGVLEPQEALARLAPAHHRAAGDLVTLMERMAAPATVVLTGGSDVTRRRIAVHAAAGMGRICLIQRGSQVSASGSESAGQARLVEREVALLGGLLYVDCADGTDPAVLDAYAGRLGCPVVLGDPGGLVRLTTRTAPVRRGVPDLDAGDRLALWRGAFGPAAARYGEALREVAGHFQFDATTVEAVCAEQEAGGHDVSRLYHVCRAQGRGGLEELAQAIAPRAKWADLVVPEAAMEALHDIARTTRHRGRVYDDWGMAGGTGRGLGVTALFAGESGTGKTLAAEVLAGALDLDLYRIDLASVVSKYIGETEKNLKRVFDAAEAGGAVLLFDEADALFGKRSEVKDSHDRYANVEVAYLLQRMEAYRGLAILTTNFKNALDRAFLRRIQFVVTFPFPTEVLRQAIWLRQFPATVPTEGLDFGRLAQLQLPGGNIRAIALSAAFLAAESGGPLRMAHLRQAAGREYAKLEKPLTDAEIRGWL